MPLLQRTDSVAANGFNANVWTGTQFEFCPYAAAMIELGVLGSATGLNVNFATGADVTSLDQAVSVVRAANQYPLYPDDFVHADVLGFSQRIVEQIRNTTAGALSHFSSLRLNPLG